MCTWNQHNLMLIKNFEFLHVLLNSIAFNQLWILILFSSSPSNADADEQYESEDDATRKIVRRSGWLFKPEPYFDCDVYCWSTFRCDCLPLNICSMVSKDLQPLLSATTKATGASETLRTRLGHCYRNNWNYGLTKTKCRLHTNQCY